jgi:hypothetical protein
MSIPDGFAREQRTVMMNSAQVRCGWMSLSR